MATVILSSVEAMLMRHLFRDQFVEKEEWFGPAPIGKYDVVEYLKTLPAPFNNPSLLLVSFEFGKFSRPVNLANVKCPKLLMIGDSATLAIDPFYARLIAQVETHGQYRSVWEEVE